MTLTTFQALIDEESARTAEARSRLGKGASLALYGIGLLNTAVASISPGQGVLAAFMFAIQKSAGLAYLSYVRGHTVQGEFNCRQAIEFTALLAHLSACPEIELLKIGADGSPEFRNRQKVSSAAYAWLEANEPELNEHLKEFKANINDSTAHASAYTTHFTVDPETWNDGGGIFGGAFFDRLTVNETRAYLMSFCRLIVLMLETAQRANADTKLIRWRTDLEQQIEIYASAIDRYRLELAAEMKAAGKDQRGTQV